MEKKISQNFIESDENDNILNGSDESNTDNEEDNNVTEDNNAEPDYDDDIEDIIEIESFIIGLLNRCIFMLWKLIMDSFRRE